jgi:hypothetical protein
MDHFTGIQSIKLTSNGITRRTSLQDALQLVGQPQFSLDALKALVTVLNFDSLDARQSFSFSFVQPDGKVVLLDSNDAVAQSFWAAHNARQSTLSLTVVGAVGLPAATAPLFYDTRAAPSPSVPLYAGLISSAPVEDAPTRFAAPTIETQPKAEEMWERHAGHSTPKGLASPGDEAAACFIRCSNGLCHSSSNWPTVMASGFLASLILVASYTDMDTRLTLEEVFAIVFTPEHLAELVCLVTGILTLCCVGYCCVGCNLGCLSCALSGCTTWACGLFNWLSFQALVVNLVVVIPMNILMTIAYTALRLSGVIWFVNKNFNYVVTNSFYFGQEEVSWREASHHTFIDACQVAFKAFFPLQDVLEVPNDEIRQRCLVIFRAVFGRVMPQMLPLWFKKSLAFRMFCAFSFQTVMGWWLIGPGHIQLLSPSKKTTIDKDINNGEKSTLLGIDQDRLESAKPMMGGASIQVAYEGQQESLPPTQTGAQTSTSTQKPRSSRRGKVFKGRRPQKEESLDIEVKIWDCTFLREARTWAGDTIDTVGGVGDDVCVKE